MYIHELPDWPHFSWNQQQSAELLVQIRHQQGRLIGGMESIGFHLREQAVLQTLTQDVLKSSEIEGEMLDLSEVRSSVARHLGMEQAALGTVDRNVDGVVEMVLDATQNFDKPLTKERLFSWHRALFPEGRSGIKKIAVGKWRKGSVYVVSGQMGKEKIHFEAPLAMRVDAEMEHFLQWINEEHSMDLVLKAALAHLWFVTIHPFDDGNGRIGRAIADLLLARSEKSGHRFYSLSEQIQKERKYYYTILERTQKGTLDVTTWIEWFLGCLERAIQKALHVLEIVLNKARIWEELADVALNERQRKVLNRLLEGFEGKLIPNIRNNLQFGLRENCRQIDDRKVGSIKGILPTFRSSIFGVLTQPNCKLFLIFGITSSKWAKLAKCSQDTAYRDILDLIEKGILMRNAEGGRSSSYSLAMQKRKQ